MNTASLHDAYAADYDCQVQAYGSHVHEALFGLCYEYLQPGQRVLDLGIGTGLVAELFFRASLRVHGMDFSPAMLDICRAKGFASELYQQDMQQIPWPNASQDFEHVICCGVFHFLPSLEAIFAETQRALRAGGVFAFTTKTPAGPVDSPADYLHQVSGGIDIYSHTPEYVARLMDQAGFMPRKAMRCYVGEELFNLWVAGKDGRD